MPSRMCLPLFPLHTVLFPNGPLRLRIFEARYVDMIGHCMRNDSGFGVVLITYGREAGGPATTVEIGTAVRIVDFERLPGGLLGIRARGEQRFHIRARRQQADGLNVAEIEWLAADPVQSITPEFAAVQALVRAAYAQLSDVYAGAPPEYDDAAWVGMRLAEMLPLPLIDKQRCLEMSDPLARLGFLRERLTKAAQLIGH